MSLYQGFRGMSEDIYHSHLSNTCCENLKTYNKVKHTSESFNYMPWLLKQALFMKVPQQVFKRKYKDYGIYCDYSLAHIVGRT